MNKTVQILFLIAVLPMLGSAREETLEERKKRITRKYLRENMNVVQSGMVVPEDVEEDEQVTDSEQFKEIEVGFERQESGVQMPPPPRQRPVPLQTSENWLLTDPELDEDPYATDGGVESENDYWSLWGGRPSEERPPEASRRQQAYDRYSSQSRANETRDQGILGSRSLESGRTSLFGERESTTLPGNFGDQGSFGNQGSRAYGSSPETGLLNTPFPQQRRSEPDQSRESQQYVPHKSPYQYDYQQRRQQQGIQQPQIEYTKPDSFQQWKDRNKTWDPTGDDAYLDELMNKNRR
jgi:hypothetical protein